MPRRGENIYKRKDGRWEGRILQNRTPERKPHYTYIYGRTYAEVKEKMESHRIMTTNRLHSAVRSREMTSCCDAALQWLDSKRCKVKESTFSRYTNIIERYIIPTLGGTFLHELSNRMLAQYVDDLLCAGRIDRKAGLAPKTVSDILIVLKAVLRYAGKNGCEIDVRLEDLVVRRHRQEMRVLTIHEQNQLATLFESPEDKRCIGVMISLYAGLRLGEVCALRWENIDLNNQIIRVRTTMQRVQNHTGTGRKTKIIITEPKSESSIRDIPIPDFMVAVLRTIQAPGDAFVLSGRADKIVEPRSMENYFRRCVEKCGIASANYHALRHSFATRCIEAGFDIKSLSEILGHSNVGITLDRYVHSSFEQKRKNMNKLTMRVCA